MRRQILNQAAIALASGAVAAGTTSVVGTTIDTQGYEGIAIIAQLGTITSTGAPTLKAQGGAASNGSDAADIMGSAVAANDTQSNKALALQIYRPQQRYITPVLLRPTANAVVVSIIVILFGASLEPVTQAYIVNSAALNGTELGDPTLPPA